MSEGTAAGAGLSHLTMVGHEVVGPAGGLHAWRLGTPDRHPVGASPVLLLHGVNGSSRDWLPVAGILARSHDVVALDYRGHGQSARIGPYGLDGYVEDVLAVLGHLHLPAVHAVGTSFGGSVAVALAARAPGRVTSVAAVGSSLHIGEKHAADQTLGRLRSLGPRAFFERVVPRFTLGPDASPQLIAAVVDCAAGNDVETIATIISSAFAADVTPEAAVVDVPALVVTGAYDATCPPPLGAALAQTLRSAHIVMPGVGHLPSLEAPAQLAALLQAHFANAERG